MTPPQVGQVEARRLLLRRQGLSGPPARCLPSLVEQLGYVQLDSINVVARAHELILHSRMNHYAQEQWHELLVGGQVFEHWTHDAAIIPTHYRRHWVARFAREARRIRASNWWMGRLGEDAEDVLQRVRERLRTQGPVMARDLGGAEAPPPGDEPGWWNWRPEKAALEYLWRTGELTVAERRNFHKVYKLSDDDHGPHRPSHAETVDWACREALQRLGLATPTQLAGFWGLVTLAEARQWCQSEPLRCEQVLDPAGRPAVAVSDWREAAQEARPSRGLKLLAPFDPILRDRGRAQLLFDFDYRFEAFVPRARRLYGYYTLPILDGERLVGRLTPKLHRRQGLLEVEQLHWEKGVVVNQARLNRLDEALQRLARFVGARDIKFRA